VGEAQVTYRVLWQDAALLELDEIWLASADKEGIQTVAMRVNTELAFRPREAGESREGNDRVLFKFPLIVWFRVIERMNEVLVLHVSVSKR
jgi:nitric oxide synthase oxygenase domain/subunit